MPEPVPERRFAVQRVVGRGWRTVSVHPGRVPAAERFAACVREEPRAVHRLIEAEAGDGGRFQEFDWRLLELHDPRRLGLSPDLSEPAPAAIRTSLPALPARAGASSAPALSGRRSGGHGAGYSGLVPAARRNDPGLKGRSGSRRRSGCRSYMIIMSI